MKTMSFRMILPALVSLCVAASALDAADPTFVERFEDGPGDRWTLDSDLDPPGLRWHREGEEPGLHFKAVAVEKYIRTHDRAYAGWDVGTEPFELSWEIHLERALQQQWFYPGVAVAVTSASPGEMGEDDIAVTIGVHMAGMAAAVRKGGFYDLHTEGRGAWSNFRDRVLSNLINRSGGGIASVDWPMKQPGGSRLRFRIRRDAENTVHFTILWPDLPGDRGKPFWTGKWTMPSNVAKIPLKYVSVKRVPVESVHVNYGSFVMQGVVRDIQGRLLDAPPAPIVEGFASTGAAAVSGGDEIAVTGRNFREGCRVTVGGRTASDVRVASAEKLTCTLPELPSPARHPLSVIGPDGLAGDLPGGVFYGRMLREVRPREAMPAGGDVVTVLGGGFDEDTVFSFGGRPGEVVELIDSTRARVRAPEGKIGRAAVTARAGDAEFPGEPLFGYAPHPYLFFRAEDLPELREKLAMPMFRHYRERLLREADRFVEREVGGNFNASVGATMVLSITYALTEEPKYKDKLMEWVRRGRQATQYSDFHMMSVAGMAVAYDVLFAELSPEDRAAVQDYLDRMLTGYMKDARGSWFLGGPFNFSNTVPVGNSGGMLAGLALMHSTPTAVTAVDTAARKAKLYPDTCISPDGGCREGIQYWDYGLSFHLILAHALNNATGDDRGLLDHPHLKRNVNFIRTQLGGHGGMYAFCDAREPWLDGYAICADLGSRYDQPLMLWVADLAAKGGEKTRAREIWAPFAFLWRSTTPAPKEFPGVPTLSYLKDMQWGGMRSDSTFIPALAVGVKGSRGPLTHHKQKDLGSYVVHANGEAYLVDPGYYEGKETDHTLPLIDGKGPGVSGSSITEAWEAGPWRHMTVDSTDGYGKAARRVRRLIVMHGDDAVVVLDDLIPAEGRSGEITAQYQTAWPPEIDKKAPGMMVLTGQKGRLAVRCYGQPVKLSATDRKFSSGWHWAKIDESGPGDWHSVSGTYTADPDRPLVTVLTPAAGDAPLPAAPTCEYAESAVTVKLPGGQTVRFERTDDGWRFVRP